MREAFTPRTELWRTQTQATTQARDLLTTRKGEEVSLLDITSDQERTKQRASHARGGPDRAHYQALSL